MNQRSDAQGDTLGKRSFEQEDIAGMLCPEGATEGCPGEADGDSLEEDSANLCDVDQNGQVDARDLLTLFRNPQSVGTGSGAIQWSSCLSKCTYRGCSIGETKGGKCGLLGLEVFFVLLPLKLRRKRSQSRS